MKKSWIKSLLVVIMAVLLVVTLAACDDKPETPPNEGGGSGEFTSADYFNKLWDLTSDIGGTAINTDDKDTLAVHLGAVVDIAVKNSRSGSPYQRMDLGVDVQAVVGRKPATSKDTALKVKLYDPTDAANSEIVTLYLFANELDNIYIDFAGHNIKLPHDVAKTVWNDILGKTGELGAQIAGTNVGLNYLFGDDDEDKQSINDIIDDFVGDFGPNWTLNTPINKVIEMLGVNLKDILTDNQLISAVLGFVQLDVDDLFDASGNLDLLKILRVQAVQAAFEPSKNTVGDVTTYKASISPSIVAVALGDTAVDLFGQGSTADQISDLALIFTEKDEAIDSFSIFAKLGGVIIPIRQGVTAIPELTVTITDLSIAKKDNSNGIAFNKDNYSEKIAVREQLAVEAHGITIKPITGLNTKNIVLDGKVELTLIGELDLVNETDNGTKLNLYVDLTNGSQDAERIATVSFVDGVLAGKLQGSFADGIKIDGQTYKGFTANLDFNVATEFKGLLSDIVDKFKKSDKEETPETPADPDEEEEVEEEEEEEVDTTLDENGEMFAREGAAWTIANWIKAIKVVMPLVSTDNNLKVETTDAIKLVVNVANCFGEGYIKKVEFNSEKDKNETTYVFKEFFKWSKNGRQAYIVDLLSNPPLADKSLQDCIDLVMNKSDEETDEEKVKTSQIVLRVLYLCAQSLRLDGVTELTDADADAYVDNIEAVLSAGVEIVGDVQNGVHCSVKVTVGEAMLKVTESLDVIDVIEEGDVDEDGEVIEEVTFEVVEAPEAPEELENWKDLSEFFNKLLTKDEEEEQEA